MSLRVGVLTVSDGCAAGVREDVSGAVLEGWARDLGHTVTERALVPDDALTITRHLLTWADSGRVDAILTTGGTGFGARDVTPEATAPVLDREATGLAEAVRRRGEAATPLAPLSRARVGSRGAVFIANLPGSPGGVKDGLAILGPLIPHVVELLAGVDSPHRAAPADPLRRSTPSGSGEGE